MKDFHFITENPWGETIIEKDITFKIRHTPEFAKGKIVKTPDGYNVVSDNKIQGIAPGQFGVIYDQNSKICIGSGEMS